MGLERQARADAVGGASLLPGADGIFAGADAGAGAVGQWLGHYNAWQRGQKELSTDGVRPTRLAGADAGGGAVGQWLGNCNAGQLNALCADYNAWQLGENDGQELSKRPTFPVEEIAGNIGDAWKEGSHVGDSRKESCRSAKELSEQKHIRLVFVNGSNGEDETFDVPPSATLKSCFTEYAERRGVSLRSLRFSHHGETMFLSSAGKKSPEELRMKDSDVITVHDTSASREASDALHPTPCKTGREKTAAGKKEPRRHKCISKKKRTTKRETVVTPKTPEEYKRRHFAILSRVHEEMQPRLKHIRTRLTALDLQRQPPKWRKKVQRKKAPKRVDPQLPPDTTTGGKAGRPYFLVRVGDENNLYRTTKLPPQNRPGPCDIPVLDLHGFTREEALTKLEENLKVWVDTAIQGSFPFVIPAMIVCGCGNQILSETVQRWIKSTKYICNAPKNAT